MGKEPKGVIPEKPIADDDSNVALADPPASPASKKPAAIPARAESTLTVAQPAQDQRPFASELDGTFAKMKSPDGVGCSFDEWTKVRAFYPTDREIEGRWHQVQKMLALRSEGDRRKFATAEKSLADFQMTAAPEREKLLAERARIDAALAESELTENQKAAAFARQQAVRAELRRLTGLGVESKREYNAAKRLAHAEFRELPGKEARLTTIRGVLAILAGSVEGEQQAILHVNSFDKSERDLMLNYFGSTQARTVHLNQSAWASYRNRLCEEQETLAPEVENLVAAKERRLAELDDSLLDGNW